MIARLVRKIWPWSVSKTWGGRHEDGRNLKEPILCLLLVSFERLSDEHPYALLVKISHTPFKAFVGNLSFKGYLRCSLIDRPGF